jgi:hypothetical protein
MRYFKRINIGLTILSLFAFLGCQKSTVTPVATSSTVSFWNTTYTTLVLTFNGTTVNLSPNDSTYFVVPVNTNFSYSAYTSANFGDTVYWGPTNIVTPSSGNQVIPFAITSGSGIYYLEVQNNSPTLSINWFWVSQSPIFVNGGNLSGCYIGGQIPISVPNDNNTYGIGYFNTTNSYIIFHNSGNVSTNCDNGLFWQFAPPLNFINASPMTGEGVNPVFLASCNGTGN